MCQCSALTLLRDSQSLRQFANVECISVFSKIELWPSCGTVNCYDFAIVDLFLLLVGA